MVRAVSWGMVLAFLAGCLSGSGPGGEPVGPGALPSTDAIAFTTPVDVLDGGFGYEPSIDVAPNGAVVVTAARTPGKQGAGAMASWLRISFDNGTTWQDLPSPGGAQTEAIALEGDTAVDAAGRLYFADTAVADSTFSRWSLGTDGATWESTRPLGSSGVDDRPWLAAQGDGIVYYISNNGGDRIAPEDVLAGRVGLSRFWLYTSEDAGDTWSLGRGLIGGSLCNLAASPADDRSVAAACYAVGGDSLQVYTSDDRGVTLDGRDAGPLQDAAGFNFPSLAFDMAGNLVTAWIDGHPDDTADSLRFSRQIAGEWSPLDITPFEGAFAFAWMAATGDGTAAVTFYATTDLPPGPSSEWFAFVLLSENATAPEPAWTLAKLQEAPVNVGREANPDYFQATFAADGALHVAYAVRAPPAGVANVDRITDHIMHVRQLAGPNLQ